MGNERYSDCCDNECVNDYRDRCCGNNCGGDDNSGGISLIWILIILYLLSCAGGNGNGRGGLLGGLF